MSMLGEAACLRVDQGSTVALYHSKVTSGPKVIIYLNHRRYVVVVNGARVPKGGAP